MKCATHNTEATSVCPRCGKAMCPSCSRFGSAERPACSDACASALVKADKATELVIRKSIQLAKAGAVGCYLFDGVFLAFAPFSLWMLPRLRVAPILLVVAGVAMIIMGVWYGKAAKQSE